MKTIHTNTIVGVYFRTETISCFISISLNDDCKSFSNYSDLKHVYMFIVNMAFENQRQFGFMMVNSAKIQEKRKNITIFSADFQI